jgi:hypothetical protein
MFTSRLTTVSLLALTMSVHVCLLQATANARVLAQKSAAVVAIQAQGKKGAQAASMGAEARAQADCPAKQVIHQSIKLSSQDEKIIASSPMPRETFCALLSKYLSLS